MSEPSRAVGLNTRAALRVGATAILLLLGACALKDDGGPTPGSWRVAGVDANGVNWAATFMLERNRSDAGSRT